MFWFCFTFEIGYSSRSFNCAVEFDCTTTISSLLIYPIWTSTLPPPPTSVLLFVYLFASIVNSFFDFRLKYTIYWLYQYIYSGKMWKLHSSNRECMEWSRIELMRWLCLVWKLSWQSMGCNLYIYIDIYSWYFSFIQCKPLRNSVLHLWFLLRFPSIVAQYYILLNVDILFNFWAILHSDSHISFFSSSTLFAIVAGEWNAQFFFSDYTITFISNEMIKEEQLQRLVSFYFIANITNPSQ